MADTRVTAWLEENNLAVLLPVFSANQVDWDDLFTLTKADLCDELRIEKLAHRKLLWDALEKLRNREEHVSTGLREEDVAALQKGTEAQHPDFDVQNAWQVDTQLKIVQKVRGILNRITKQTYDVLSEEMWGLLSTHKLMESPEMLERVVDTIFDVALVQADFDSLAADICLFVFNKSKSLKQQVVEGEETPIATPHQEFRRILLNKCQNMFDSSCDHVAVVAPDTASEEEREAVAAKEKKFWTMSLANITFMAQLFNRSLLSERIMHMHVIARLLQKDHTEDRNSWLLEFLVKLMELTGKRLDKDYIRTYMDSYFSQLDTISRTHPDTRLRHLTFNLCEMRRAGWRTREEVKANESNENLQDSRAQAADWKAAQANLKEVEEPPAPKKKGGNKQQQPGAKKEGKATKAAAAKEAPKAAAPKAAAPPSPEPVA